MDPGFIVRKVEGADLKEVKAIADARLRETYSEEVLLYFYEEHKQSFFIATDGERALGFVLGVPLDNRTMRVLMLAVLEGSSSKGIGRTLLGTIESYAVMRKMTSVVLEVGVDNEKAIDFYSKLGYKVTSLVPQYYKDKRDAFVMKRFLPM